ncbi:MAG: HPr family phosphocarrier protein [Chlamydiia bacterium]|nr:HPr family phosphocarrier protein [Chlamydiia bacterium]
MSVKQQFISKRLNSTSTKIKRKVGCVKGSFIVINDKGLHTRPSTELVKCATSFRSQINLIYQDFTVNAKSLLGILTLAATRGSRIDIEAVGEDAEEAVYELIDLARNKFYIHY